MWQMAPPVGKSLRVLSAKNAKSPTPKQASRILPVKKSVFPGQTIRILALKQMRDEPLTKKDNEAVKRIVAPTAEWGLRQIGCEEQ